MSSLILQDQSPMRGDLRLTVRDAITREIKRNLLIKNTITYGALNAILQLISQLTDVAPTDFKIEALQIGTNATAPVRAQTALIAPVLTLTLSDVAKIVTNSGPYELRVVTTLGADQCNELTLCEAGLFMHNGSMFARQTHPPIPKSSAIVIDYDWRIDLTA